MRGLDSTAPAEDGATVVAGREEAGGGEDNRRGECQEVCAKALQHLTPSDDEFGVLLDLKDFELPGLLQSEDGVGGAVRDEAGDGLRRVSSKFLRASVDSSCSISPGRCIISTWDERA